MIASQKGASMEHQRPVLRLEFTASQLIGIVACMSAIYLIAHEETVAALLMFALGYVAVTRTAIPGARSANPPLNYDGWLCRKSAELIDAGASDYKEKGALQAWESELKPAEALFIGALAGIMDLNRNGVESALDNTGEPSVELDGDEYVPRNAVGKLLIYAAVVAQFDAVPINEWISEGKQWILRRKASAGTEVADVAEAGTHE